MNRRGLIIGASALAASRALAAPALVQSDIVIGRGRYGSPCDGVNSDSDAIDLAVADIVAGGRNPGLSVIHLPTMVGVSRAHAGLSGITFMGQGDAVGTYVNVVAPIPGGIGRALFDFSTSTTGRYGGGMRNLSMDTGPHTGGLTLINLVIPPDGKAPANTRFADLRIGSGLAGPGGVGTSWLPWRHIQLIGSPSTSPVGLREISLERISAFGATSTVSIYIDRMAGGGGRDIGTYPGGAGSQLYVLNSFAVEFTGLNLQGGGNFWNNTVSRFVTKAGVLL